MTEANINSFRCIFTVFNATRYNKLLHLVARKQKTHCSSILLQGNKRPIVLAGGSCGNEHFCCIIKQGACEMPVGGGLGFGSIEMLYQSFTI